MRKPIYILGINESHGATAALLKNGEIIAVASEERFTRKKNESGYPKQAIEFCLNFAGITSKQLTGVYLGFLHPISLILKERTSQKSFHALLSSLSSSLQLISNASPKTSYAMFKAREVIFKNFFFKRLQRKHINFISQNLDIDPSLIHPIDHQTAHGYAAHYANPQRQQKSLVITCDGAGDDVCSRIFTVKNGVWERIASTPNAYSLGLLYLYITLYLGMKPNEHEYKVMGLAPYAHREDAKKMLMFFKNIMWVDGLTIRSRVPHIILFNFLRQHLNGIRFDAIAGGVQIFTEDLLTNLVKNAIKKTGINALTLGGGVFMNVKANMRIANIPSLKHLFIMPTSTDESTAIGAAYYGYQKICVSNSMPFHSSPLKNIYLGPRYPEREIAKALKTVLTLHKNIKIKKLLNPAKEVAKLLAEEKIIARFTGRMEYGARALGNRSILARADNTQVIRIINNQIKNRDFWMPFAPIILNERTNDYLVNPKQLDSPFMMMSFETTPRARKELIAAIHPYDYTARPQILSMEQNPTLHTLLKEFEKLTGFGGLLNTSFNIHGEPIVCSPEDAINTFQKSGLQYLALENYLLEKTK